MCVLARFNPSKPGFTLSFSQAATLMSQPKSHSHFIASKTSSLAVLLFSQTFSEPGNGT